MQPASHHWNGTMQREPGCACICSGRNKDVDTSNTVDCRRGWLTFHACSQLRHVFKSALRMRCQAAFTCACLRAGTQACVYACIFTYNDIGVSTCTRTSTPRSSDDRDRLSPQMHELVQAAVATPQKATDGQPNQQTRARDHQSPQPE